MEAKRNALRHLERSKLNLRWNDCMPFSRRYTACTAIHGPIQACRTLTRLATALTIRERNNQCCDAAGFAQSDWQRLGFHREGEPASGFDCPVVSNRLSLPIKQQHCDDNNVTDRAFPTSIPSSAHRSCWHACRPPSHVGMAQN